MSTMVIYQIKEDYRKAAMENDIAVGSKELEKVTEIKVPATADADLYLAENYPEYCDFDRYWWKWKDESQ